MWSYLKTDEEELGLNAGQGRGRLTILALAIAAGVLMLATGLVLASQSRSGVYNTDTSPANFTLPPGGEKFWFGEGNMGGGVRNIVYFAITSPPDEDAEFKVTVMGSVNGTIFTAASPYSETQFTIPPGTREANYSIFNPAGVPIKVIGAEVIFSEVDYPNLWLGDTLLYLGIAVVAVSLLGFGLLMRRRTAVQARNQ